MYNSVVNGKTRRHIYICVDTICKRPLINSPFVVIIIPLLSSLRCRAWRTKGYLSRAHTRFRWMCVAFGLKRKAIYGIIIIMYRYLNDECKMLYSPSKELNMVFVVKEIKS